MEIVLRGCGQLPARAQPHGDPLRGPQPWRCAGHAQRRPLLKYRGGRGEAVYLRFATHRGSIFRAQPDSPGRPTEHVPRASSLRSGAEDPPVSVHPRADCGAGVPADRRSVGVDQHRCAFDGVELRPRCRPGQLAGAGTPWRKRGRRHECPALAGSGKRRRRRYPDGRCVGPDDDRQGAELADGQDRHTGAQHTRSAIYHGDDGARSAGMAARQRGRAVHRGLDLRRRDHHGDLPFPRPYRYGRRLADGELHPLGTRPVVQRPCRSRQSGIHAGGPSHGPAGTATPPRDRNKQGRDPSGSRPCRFYAAA